METLLNGSTAVGALTVKENDGDDKYRPYNEQPETYIVPVIFGIIFLVGVIGNGCLIYILLRHKSMRSIPNTFIFNLALGDLFILLFTVPFTSTIYTFEVGKSLVKNLQFSSFDVEERKLFIFSPGRSVNSSARRLNSQR